MYLDPPPDDDPRWNQVVHYFAGELPADQAAALRQWIEADPERRELIAQWQEVWQLAAQAPHQWDAKAGLRRVRAEAPDARSPRLVTARIEPNFARLPGTRPHRLRTLARVAAVVTLAAGAGFLWRLRPAPVAAPADQAAALTEYRARARQRLVLRLPDRTQVTLAPGSVLRPSATYGRAARDVRLEGEAYFVVTHDATRPFAVHTPRAVARDLGTRFVVRAYASDAATDVVVAEGLVAVGRPTPTMDVPAAVADSVVLSARQRARITDAGRVEVARGIALDGYLGWTEGRLVFTKTPLRDVVRQLERWYGIEIRLADARLGERRLTATLFNESPEEALDLVASVLELAVSHSADRYTIGLP